MRIIWTEPAARALERIQDYITRDNRRAAWEVTQTIRHAVSQLEDHPKPGRPGRVRGILELVIPKLPCVVPYRIKGREVQILSIFHTARKWPEEFE
ncbi:MAG: type II toxin-antitoxin system RelE/ParE family toxin [Thiogranum sp.]